MGDPSMTLHLTVASPANTYAYYLLNMPSSKYLWDWALGEQQLRKETDFT